MFILTPHNSLILAVHAVVTESQVDDNILQFSDITRQQNDHQSRGQTRARRPVQSGPRDPRGAARAAGLGEGHPVAAAEGAVLGVPPRHRRPPAGRDRQRLGAGQGNQDCHRGWQTGG